MLGLQPNVDSIGSDMPNAIVDFLKELGLQILIKKDSVGIQIGGNQRPLTHALPEDLPETDDSSLMNDEVELEETRRDTIPVQGQVIDLPTSPPAAARRSNSQGK